MKQASNLIEVARYFSDESVCRKHLEQIRWRGTPACPFCGSIKIYRFSNGILFKCGEKQCNKKFSVKVGTFFENSKIPLSKWFVAIYLITSHKKGISSCQLAKDISVKQQTAWFMLHRIRAMMQDKEKYEFNGVSECDEVFVGGKMRNMHKHIRAKIRAEKGERGTETKIPVMAILERGKGKIYTEKLEDVKGETLKKVVRDNVKKGSKLMTDNYAGYTGLDKDYDHQTVSHATDEYVRGEAHTNTVEGFFSLLQRAIYGIYHSVSAKHLIRYCNESGFRYETRGQGEIERLNNSMANCEGRLKYADLIGKKPTLDAATTKP